MPTDSDTTASQPHWPAAGSPAESPADSAGNAAAVAPAATAPTAGTLDASGHGRNGALWRDAARAAVFLRPRWTGVQAGPLQLALLAALGLGLSVALDRAYIVGPAEFHAGALQAGWWTVLVMAWASWLLVPHPTADASRPRDAVALFAVQWAQGLLITAALAAAVVPLVRSGAWDELAGSAGVLPWLLSWLPALWYVAATLVLMARVDGRRGSRGSLGPGPLRALALAGVTATLVAATFWQAPRLWYPAPQASNDATPRRLTLDELQLQDGLLARQLDAIEAGRPGVIDVFALTFAPYAEEDVFRRESALVAGLMRSRFGSQGRTLELVTHRQALAEMPVATAAHLKQAIAGMAARMDRGEDVLFIHLTSHGARDGELSASLDLLAVEPVRPEQLKAWLDEAGIRWRVVSVSACYSGSWIGPLADESTLVMTAADREHTSYGCGRGSELTYFGRAMFDEALRTTRSFEQAHASARTVIDEREKAAGKTDGYSNPQIHVGAAVRPVLQRLHDQLAATDR